MRKEQNGKREREKTTRLLGKVGARSYYLQISLFTTSYSCVFFTLSLYTNAVAASLSLSLSFSISNDEAIKHTVSETFINA